LNDVLIATQNLSQQPISIVWWREREDEHHHIASKNEAPGHNYREIPELIRVDDTYKPDMSERILFIKSVILKITHTIFKFVFSFFQTF
jgi:hypothetical protein